MSDFADPDKRADWIENRNMLVFQLRDPGNAERSVDIFVREPFDFGLMRSEAVTKNLDGVTIPVASIRHLIAMKSDAGRSRDVDDIVHLRQIAIETGQALA